MLNNLPRVDNEGQLDGHCHLFGDEQPIGNATGGFIPVQLPAGQFWRGFIECGFNINPGAVSQQLIGSKGCAGPGNQGLAKWRIDKDDIVGLVALLQKVQGACLMAVAVACIQCRQVLANLRQGLALTVNEIAVRGAA